MSEENKLFRSKLHGRNNLRRLLVDRHTAWIERMCPCSERHVRGWTALSPTGLADDEEDVRQGFGHAAG
jgi:hypothetical protein